jgi:G:T-mismatch repair DNA endonuclease (very short patch repair protein)
MARDVENEKELENMGWTVIRFWGKEIKKYLTECVNEVKVTIYEIENNIYRIEYEKDYSENIDLMAAEVEPEYNIDKVK